MSVELTSDEEKKIRVKVLKTHDLLQEKYGKQVRNSKSNPLDELILTVLSQNTTQTHSHTAFDQLKKKFKAWEALMAAPAEQISRAIQTGGLNRTKALRLKRILRRIYKDQGSLSLDFLKVMEAGEALKYLISVKGVGARTASSVLLFSLNKSVMPINTHVERVSKRLGWIWNHASLEETQEIFHRVTPRYLVISLYSQLVKHGRVICKVKRPNCQCCVVRHDCDYYRQKKGRGS
jgi:endonuclease-3